MFVSVPLKLIVALAVAMLMNQKLRGVSFYRAVYYIPTLLGGSVAIAVLWRKLFEKDGLVNLLLGAIGFTDLPGWITNPKYALWTLVLLTVITSYSIHYTKLYEGRGYHAGAREARVAER